MKKKLAKFMSMIMIAALIVTGFTGFSGNVGAYAAEGDTPLLIATQSVETAKITVSVSNKGELVLKQKSVEVTDVDSDGKLTCADALYCTHEKYYEGGAEAGFALGEGGWVSKFWGDASGNYFFYLNDKSTSGATDPISDGDYYYILMIKDTVNWSDMYSYFNTHKLGIKKNASKTIKLNVVDKDENWNPVIKPVQNAVIKINEDYTEISTNKKGRFKFTSNQSGSYFISAEAEDINMAPPTLLIFVQPEKGEVIEVKNKKYTVTKLGTVKTGKKGKVTFSKSANNGKEAPKTIEYAGVTYKVKVVD